MPTSSQHRALDQVVARYLVANPDKMASTTTVLELIVWSGSHLEPSPDPGFVTIEPEALAAGVAAAMATDHAMPMPSGGGEFPPPPGFMPLEVPQTLALEAKQARDSIASSAQALAPGSIASQRRQGGPAMPMPPPAPRGFTPPAPRPSTSPEYSNSCAHAPNRLQDYGAGSMCQDCNTVFPTYKRAP